VVFAAGLSSATEAPPLLRNDVVDPFASRPVALAAPEDDDASLVEEPAFDVRANHLLDPFALANAVVDPFDRTPPPAEVPQVEYRCVDRY
jgi:Tfp pilus assembly protein FimV